MFVSSKGSKRKALTVKKGENPVFRRNESKIVMEIKAKTGKRVDF